MKKESSDDFFWLLDPAVLLYGTIHSTTIIDRSSQRILLVLCNAQLINKADRDLLIIMHRIKKFLTFTPPLPPSLTWTRQIQDVDLWLVTT